MIMPRVPYQNRFRVFAFYEKEICFILSEGMAFKFLPQGLIFQILSL
jgi:hypothetical protein